MLEELLAFRIVVVPDFMIIKQLVYRAGMVQVLKAMTFESEAICLLRYVCDGVGEGDRGPFVGDLGTMTQDVGLVRLRHFKKNLL